MVDAVEREDHGDLLGPGDDGERGAGGVVEPDVDRAQVRVRRELDVTTPFRQVEAEIEVEAEEDAVRRLLGERLPR